MEEILARNDVRECLGIRNAWMDFPYLAYIERKNWVVWGWVLAAFAVVLTLAAQIWYVPLKYWTSRRQWRAPKILGLADRGLCFIDSYVRLFAAWKSFHHFEEVRRAFLIYTSKDDYYLLSKRYFSPEQRAELKRRLQENVSESTRA